MTNANQPKTQFSLGYDLADLPALAHAFAIAATEAMCSESSSMRKRFDEFRSEIEANSPVPDTKKIEEYTWFDVIRAMANAKTFRVSHPVTRWQDTADVTVFVNDQAYQLARWVKRGDPCVPAIRDTLMRVAPLEARDLTTEDLA